MAAKGSRKDCKVFTKSELDVERFVSDILSFIFPVCGFPIDKIKFKGKLNAYRDDDFVIKASAIVMEIAMSMRDRWKTMFESRLKNSGFDTIEKIEKYLKSFLRISREFQKGNASMKVFVSLAAYSEIMLFLNSKGIEFDYEQLLDLWSLNLLEHIAQQRNTGEVLNNLFGFHFDPTKFIQWITAFIVEFAYPYGCRDDVSEIFRLHPDRLKMVHNEINYQLAEMLPNLLPPEIVTAEEPAPVLPPCFESPADLPGNRESPEPPESSESGPCEGKKRPRRRRTVNRLTGVSGCGSKGGQRRKTVSDRGIEDRLGQMSLTSEDNPQEN